MAKKVTPVETGFVDIQLSRPIEIDGAQVTALRMREPTVGDQLLAEEMKGITEAAREVMLLANLCEVTPEDIKKVKLRDYKEVQKTLMGFIG